MIWRILKWRGLPNQLCFGLWPKFPYFSGSYRIMLSSKNKHTIKTQFTHYIIHPFEMYSSNLVVYIQTKCNHNHSLDTRGGVYNIDVTFMPEHSTDTCSLHFNQLWVFILTATHCTMVLLWWWLRDTVIYGFKDICFGGSLMLCPYHEFYIIKNDSFCSLLKEK